MAYSVPRVELFSSVNQTITTANVAQIVSFNNTIMTNKITITSTTRFTIIEAGRYLVTCNPQVDLSGPGTNQTFNMWTRVNGSDIANSNNKWGIVNQNDNLNLSFFQSVFLNVGDFVEIWMSGTSTSLLLMNSAPGGGAPATPSAQFIMVKTNIV
jgi:hypothetical protein